MDDLQQELIIPIDAKLAIKALQIASQEPDRITDLAALVQSLLEFYVQENNDDEPEFSGRCFSCGADASGQVIVSDFIGNETYMMCSNCLEGIKADGHIAKVEMLEGLFNGDS